MLLKLKEAILKSGYKQRFVAQKAGIPENRFTKIVTGRQGISGDEKRRVASVLGEDVEKLFPKKVPKQDPSQKSNRVKRWRSKT